MTKRARRQHLPLYIAMSGRTQRRDSEKKSKVDQNRMDKVERLLQHCQLPNKTPFQYALRGFRKNTTAGLTQMGVRYRL